MPRLLCCLFALSVAADARAEQAWPVATGPARDPAPYRYHPRSLPLVPKPFLDDSAAVILYAGSTYRVEPDGTVEATTHEITRLNGRKAIEKLGEFRGISFAPSHQKVTLHLARIHKPDGKVIDAQPRHAHLRDVGTDYQVYDPEKQLIISFPSLEVGDVIEVKWTVRGKNPEHGGQFFTRYSFGDTTNPIVLDELRVQVPDSMPLSHASSFGDVAPLVVPSKGHRLYVWRKSHLPPTPRDDDLPSREELRTSVLASTFASWKQVGEWKHRLRAACWKCTPRIQRLVREVTKGCNSPVEKAQALTYWVRRNLRYVSAGERHDYTPHLPEDVLANRYGDCKDTSQLLATMLREAGLTVELATLGTFDDGSVHPDVPSPWGTHAILLVTLGGKQHWIDTTARLAGWDVLPKDDLDRLCYVTDDKGNLRLVRTPKPTADMARSEQMTTVRLDPSGSSRCERVSVSPGGLAAMTQRGHYLGVPVGERRRHASDELRDANGRARLLELTIDEKTLNDFGKPVTVRTTFEIPRHFTGTTEKEGSVTDSRVWNRLLSRNVDHERTSVMELPGPFESVHVYRFHLPPAFVLDGMPKEKRITSWWGTFEKTVKSLDDGDLVRDVEITFHTKVERWRVEPNDHEAYRRFHEDVNREYRVWVTMKPATDLASAALMEKQLAATPKDAATAAILAKVYLKADRPADARRVLEAACARAPDDETLWELRVQAADTPDQEEAAQRELVKRFDANRDHVLALGRILVSAGKQKEARELLVGLTKDRGCSDAEKAKAYFQLARSHYRKDEPKEAVAAWDAAAKLDRAAVGTVRGFMLRGQALEDLKDLPEAQKAYRMALTLDGKNQDVLTASIRVSVATKDEASALDALRRYVLAVDRDAAGLAQAAETYLSLGRFDEAFDVAMRSRDVSFTERAQRVLGLVYARRGDHERAAFHLQKAEADAVVVAALVRATANAGKLDELDALAEKAERLKQPSDESKAAAREARELLARRKALGKAVAVPKGKEAEYSAALDALACAEDARRRGAAYDKLLAKASAVEIGPAIGLKARFELSRGNLGKARADAVRALKTNPDDVNGLYVRGRLRESVADLERAAKLSGRTDAEVLLALSEAYAAAGERAEAVAAAREALRLRPDDAELKAHLAGLEGK